MQILLFLQSNKNRKLGRRNLGLSIADFNFPASLSLIKFVPHLDFVKISCNLGSNPVIDIRILSKLKRILKTVSKLEYISDKDHSRWHYHGSLPKVKTLMIYGFEHTLEPLKLLQSSKSPSHLLLSLELLPLPSLSRYLSPLKTLYLPSTNSCMYSEVTSLESSLNKKMCPNFRLDLLYPLDPLLPDFDIAQLVSLRLSFPKIRSLKPISCLKLNPLM
jgi:hypothetical protein